jgi:hypothetical protein
MMDATSYRRKFSSCSPECTGPAFRFALATSARTLATEVRDGSIGV